ncbi:MAG: DUF3788 family protein [Coprobacillaceae bacterium]
MATSIFEDKQQIPTIEEVEMSLKEVLSVWEHLLDYIEQHYGKLQNEWKFYSKKAGWTYRVSNDKRNIVFLTPNDSYFLVTINMSEKVGKQVLSASVSEDVKTMIKEARVYMEGIGILLKIGNKNDLEDIKTILEIRDTKN